MGRLVLKSQHRVLCGDSTKAEDVERLLDGAVPNLMVTDPPYGVNYDPQWRTEAVNWTGYASRGEVIAGDDRVDWSDAYGLFPGDVAYVWHSGLHSSEVLAGLADHGFEARAQIIWAKPYGLISRGHYNWQHEPCWYLVRKGATASWQGDSKQTTVWEVVSVNNPYAKGDDHEISGHGNQKPVEVMARPIRNHEGDVYDPFLGSGTTLIAAEQLGRRCYGMEIEPRYVDVIVARWEAFTGRKAELAGDNNA